jgi:hypothetical protein
MKRCSAFVISMTFLGSILSGSVRAQAASSDSSVHAISEIGVDRSGLSSQDEATRKKTFEDIRALHATWFRDEPTSGSAQGVANFVEEVREAKQQKLKVLVNILQMDEDYDIALPMNDHGWRSKKLSEINLGKFSRRLSNLLGALKHADLSIDAVEFGNEDDSYYYDADVPNGHSASQAELHTWLQAYGQFLKTGATVLHDPRYFPEAKIITFGIAHGYTAPGHPPQSLPDPAKIVAMLKEVDHFNYLDNSEYHVDGYGTHIYASPNSPGESATALLRQDVWALGRDKAFWITEWGFTDATKLPNQKGQNASEAMQAILDAFDDLGRRVPIGPMFFYSYNSGLQDADGHPSGLVDARANLCLQQTLCRCVLRRPRRTSREVTALSASATRVLKACEVNGLHGCVLLADLSANTSIDGGDMALTVVCMFVKPEISFICC